MNEDSNKSKTLKIILLGEVNTGKTSLIKCITHGYFSPNETSTNSNYYTEKQMVINKKKYSIFIWDTVGQEKYRAVTKMFLKGSNIVFLVYSITDISSFKGIEYWLEQVKENIEDKVKIILIANKSDLIEDIKITDEEGMEYANKIGVEFKSTSAKQFSIEFEKFVEQIIINYVNENDIDDMVNKKGTSIKNENLKNKNKNNCC